MSPALEACACKHVRQTLLLAPPVSFTDSGLLQVYVCITTLLACLAPFFNVGPPATCTLLPLGCWAAEVRRMHDSHASRGIALHASHHAHGPAVLQDIVGILGAVAFWPLIAFLVSASWQLRCG